MSVGRLILLTGASGMLGQAIRSAWESEFKMVGVSLSGRAGTEACDLSDMEKLKQLFAKHPISLVVHTAAYSDVDGCEKDPEAAYRHNVIATKNLAECCKRFKVPLIHISTDYVFNGDSKHPYAEQDRRFPINIYGLTKLAAEEAVDSTLHFYCIVRVSWLFGKGNEKNFVNIIIEKLKTEKTLNVLDDQIDCPTYVEDLSEWLKPIAREMLSVAKDEEDPVYKKVFHLCNQGYTTRLEMTQAIKEALGSKASVLKASRAAIQGRLAVRPVFSAMSTERYRKTFDVSIRHWKEALMEYAKRPI